VRVPRLDYRLINYVHALPSSYKIDGQRKKKLLIDAFRAELPVEVWQRRKQGFEVPLMPWFRKELKGLLNETLNLEKIKAQKVLNPLAVNMQLNRLNSKNPGELPFILWSLFVWQTWYDKTLIEE
jgi:asparagine synthase (glutamine-hydrolysing)